MLSRSSFIARLATRTPAVATSPSERRDFMAVFTDLNRQLSLEDLPKELVPLLGKHMTKCIQYNVPDGKKNRGFSVPFTYKLLTDKSQHTEEKLRYKQKDIGLTAFNDSILLETCVYTALKQYFSDKDYYMAIVKYKTSYYSFYLPIALAMRLAEIKRTDFYEKAERILLSMGLYFQVQDDFLDCYGDPEVTGKVGTDIQDGKCSWLVVMALQRADHKQTKELALRYGSHKEEDVKWVKNLYTELGLKKFFNHYEAEFYDDIQDMIQQIRGDELPQQIFHSLLARIYKRNK